VLCKKASRAAGLLLKIVRRPPRRGHVIKRQRALPRHTHTRESRDFAERKHISVIARDFAPLPGKKKKKQNKKKKKKKNKPKTKKKKKERKHTKKKEREKKERGAARARDCRRTPMLREMRSALIWQVWPAAAGTKATLCAIIH